MRRAVPAALFVVLLAGCGREEQPLLSHGKPVAHWVEALKDPSPKARKKAVVALGHVGTADPAVIPAVVGALKDRDAGVRAEAVLALFNIGPDAREAVPALTAATKDGSARVRSYAAKALERIRGGG